MGVEAAIAISAITAAVAGATSAGYSIHKGQMEKKAAKSAARSNSREVAKQKAEALDQRKNLIDAQREQLTGVISGYNTNPTGQTGASMLRKKNEETLG